MKQYSASEDLSQLIIRNCKHDHEMALHFLYKRFFLQKRLLIRFMKIFEVFDSWQGSYAYVCLFGCVAEAFYFAPNVTIIRITKVTSAIS